MTTDPRQRVLALVRAARLLSDPLSPQGQNVREALVAQGPLSAEGVELALRDHLECEVDTSDMEALLLAAGTASRVHIVLSANVFVGALRALALGLAASTDVVLRMSRREAVFARALVQALDDEEVAGMIRFTDHVQPEPGDEVHLYGHDATMREIAADLPAGVKVRPHGSGLGIAAVGASAVLKDAARALASDVVPFDQRGCLSPRVVVVEGALERARGFARLLAEALEGLGVRVPVGHFTQDELAERRRFLDTCRMVGDVIEAGQGSVAVANHLVIPPVGRNVFVWPADCEQATSVLGPIAGGVAALGVGGSESDPLVASLRSLLLDARVSPLGWMQRPRLDGPVDLRVREVMFPCAVVRRFG